MRDEAPPAKELTVCLQLGTRRIRGHELQRVRVGSVLEIDADTGARLAIYADQQLVAHGEVTVIGGRCAVRITELAREDERAPSNLAPD